MEIAMPSRFGFLTTTFLILSCSSLPPDVSREKLETLSSKIPENSPTAALEVREGIKELAKKDYKKANEHFSEALRFEPTSGPIHFLNGLAYQLRAEDGDTSQNEFAEVGYQMALQFDPKQPWAAQQLGTLRFRQKNYVEAQNQFAYALLFERKDASLYHNLAVASYYSRDLETASMAIQKAVELEPSNSRFRATEIIIQAAGGNWEKAYDNLDLYRREVSSQNKPSLVYGDFLQNRVGDWKEFHVRNANYILAANTDGNEENEDEKKEDKKKTPVLPKKNLTKQEVEQSEKMCTIDVVIISSSQLSQTNKGLNLLSGLQLQFGGSGTFGSTWGSADAVNGSQVGTGTFTAGGGEGLNSTVTGTRGMNNTQQTTSGKTQALTSTITIPTISYNLNIFNTANDRNEVLARPTLVATDGKASEFFSGGTLRVGLQAGVGANGTLQEIPIGVKLVVTPQFISKDKLQLQVESSREFAESAAPVSSTFQQSVSTSKTRVLANVTMGFSETLILSGLTEKETAKVKQGVPFLQDIPLLQYFFSNEKTMDFNKTVLVFLTPHAPRYTDKLDEDAFKEKEVPSNVKRLKEQAGLFTPSSNVDAALWHMEKSDLYMQFRSGDLSLEKWNNFNSLSGRISQALDFLYY